MENRKRGTEDRFDRASALFSLMRSPIFFFVFFLLLSGAHVLNAQTAGARVDRVLIQYVGPTNVSEQFIRSNIRLKPGDIYKPTLSEQDVHLLYGTGQFYNIRVSIDPADDGGINVTYVVQARLRVTDVKIAGNTNLSRSKLMKKITVKPGDPLDEQKLFSDAQELKKFYEKYGYPNTECKYVFDTMDEAAGKASVTFQITESRRLTIVNIRFAGAGAFTPKELRKQLKTKQHGWFSWLAHPDRFKADQFDDDKETLIDFYHSHGYLDFEIKDVRFDSPKPNKLNIVFTIYEGRQYKVGSVKFEGNKLFDDNAIRAGLVDAHNREQSKDKLGPNGLPMDVGSVFTPAGMEKDMALIQDFYGGRGYIDVQPGTTLRANRIANIDSGTMDLDFEVDAGQQNHVERVDIRGNTKTKDKVIRREMAISPGEVFDMVRVKISQQRLENLDYFDKVTMDPQPLDPPIPGRKNLEVDVQEKESGTGKLTMGVGVSSISSVVAYAELAQGNFDLFHPPYFTGGGQKFRLLVQLGNKRQDVEVSFVEPWFLDHKLAFSVDLYRHQLNFESPNDVFDEDRTGASIGLSRDLYESGTKQLQAGIHYTIENIGIRLNTPYHDQFVPTPTPLNPQPSPVPANVPNAILAELGDHLYHRFGASLAFDTRNSLRLPNHGQRTEIDPEIDLGHNNYFKLGSKSQWYFPGLFHGHVLEIGGSAGMAKALNGGDVPFYDRYYLGGLYWQRGFKYRNVSPREPGFTGINEPIGGDSYWFASAEYSIPIIEKESGPSLRLAGFYDTGTVGAGWRTFSGNYDDNWGIGIRLDIPHLGPLRLDYGFPIHNDHFNPHHGQFQFDFGYSRPF